ncbi:MAG: hypothetical protein ACE5HI_06470 [bacterium]
MGKTISLFSGYSQKENRTTNYCLLALKMIYEENPKFLSEILSGLCGYDMSDDVGAKFRQQEKKVSSIPDGLISQKAFTIYIETKNFDWFYDQQLENHLDALNNEAQGLKVLFALGNFEGDGAKRFSHIKGLCENKFKNKIFFSAVTFEDFISALDLPTLPKNISDAIKDLRTYLDEEGLLPSWQNWLDVINCAGLPDDVLVGNVYMCPAEGGAHSHGRSKYFGMYRQKKVEKIALIRAVVDVETSSQSKLLWNNVNEKTSNLLAEAQSKLASLRPGEYPTRIFLLDTLHDTEFVKDTYGGMFGSKQYFNISRFEAEDAASLANLLKGRNWSELN